MKTRTFIPVAAVLFAALTLASPSHAQPLVTIETVAVGDAGNPNDITGYGGVAYEFNIGKYEVTLSQYSTFLNSVAATDTFNLYNTDMGSNLNIAGISRSGSSGSFSYAVIGSANRPISYVSWFDAARFANWVNNGATNGASTETGAYTLNGATTGIITKNAEATWWIPSEDEWYKAAYYKGGGTTAGYWLYPTQSNTAPGNTIGGASNQVNYWNGVYSVTQSADISKLESYLTDVGTFSNSASPYNTYDQGGNLWEWNDAVVVGSLRSTRGGSFLNGLGDLQSTDNFLYNPTVEDLNLGFRVATVPEPSTYALLAMSAAGALWLSRRRR